MHTIIRVYANIFPTPAGPGALLCAPSWRDALYLHSGTSETVCVGGILLCARVRREARRVAVSSARAGGWLSERRLSVSASEEVGEEGREVAVLRA